MQTLGITVHETTYDVVEFQRFLTMKKISITARILLENFGINIGLVNEAHLLLSTLKENNGKLKNAVYLNIIGLTVEDNNFLSNKLEYILNEHFTKDELFVLAQGTPFSDSWGNFALELFWIENF